ncbi:MAG: hypothetical protein ABL878_11805 [Burkholderiales bacterium]
MFAAVFGLAVVAFLIYGFSRRDENWITAEEGLGYILGIVGSSFILILLVYPLRKRFRPMRGWGRLPPWLKFHMMLGILGPSLVLFHANFRLGASNNAAVAMIAMLIVVASGIIGRYIYGKTHNRLSGELRSLKDFHAETQAARLEFHLDFTKLPELRGRIGWISPPPDR